MNQTLPKELRTLVRDIVSQYGKTIEKEEGKDFFQSVEKIRKLCKRFRDEPENKVLHKLIRLKSQLEKLDAKKQRKLARSFALLMEIFNICENAYRSSRLAKRVSRLQKKHSFPPISLVFTAHPTESKSIEALFLFRKLQNYVRQYYETPKVEIQSRIQEILSLLWHTPFAPHRKPSAEEEVSEMIQTILNPTSLHEIFSFEERGIPFLMRTWIGGDKDGHPRIQERTMLSSLEASRHSILQWIERILRDFYNDYRLLQFDSQEKRNSHSATLEFALRCEKNLKHLVRIEKGDGSKVKEWISIFDQLTREQSQTMRVLDTRLSKVRTILRLFPALVLPLELRENASQFQTDSNSQSPIEKMLTLLAEVSGDLATENYARALVVSMVESKKDLVLADQLVQRVLKSKSLPIVPLFETEKALQNAPIILLEFYKDRAPILHNRVEIMLGYSDSSKEFGAFPSRWKISQAMYAMDHALRKIHRQPLFFHGTGGSVERGGGSVREQTQWWPTSARTYYKATVQGEMVHRILSSPEIFGRTIESLADSLVEKKSKRLSQSNLLVLHDFSERVSSHYKRCLEDSEFMELITRATCYPFLDELAIGSRPASRTSKVHLHSLRAIPWVLCWTQSRVLFPSWWGLGSAWNELPTTQKAQMKKIWKQSSFLRSMTKLIGFSLEKVELPIWNLYLEESSLAKSSKVLWQKRFQDEYTKSLRMIRTISGRRNLLWFRPWLQESIHLRSKMIHPLNVLQLIALQNRDMALLQTTVTGISSGMLTTG